MTKDEYEMLREGLFDTFKKNSDPAYSEPHSSEKGIAIAESVKALVMLEQHIHTRGFRDPAKSYAAEHSPK